MEEAIRDNPIKNDWNQSDVHNQMLEDCLAARRGVGQPWTVKNKKFREGYDNIKWSK
jgi:hypothetical protein